MSSTKNKKSAKFQGDMLSFCGFIQVCVFTTNHHLNWYGFFGGAHDQCQQVVLFGGKLRQQCPQSV